MKSLRIILIALIVFRPLYANELVEWSAAAASQILGFSYTDNETTYWNSYKKIFTPTAWHKFIDDLNASHNIQTIHKLKLVTYIKPDTKKAKIIEYNKKTKIILPASITYAGTDIASIYPAEIMMLIGSSNKIEDLVITPKSKPQSHAIYPRGCHLRKYN